LDSHSAAEKPKNSIFGWISFWVKLPWGAVLEIVARRAEWIEIKLPPNPDGIIVTGYVHISFARPEKDN
jgi:hypothetical protein